MNYYAGLAFKFVSISLRVFIITSFSCCIFKVDGDGIDSLLFDMKKIPSSVTRVKKSPMVAAASLAVPYIFDYIVNKENSRFEEVPSPALKNSELCEWTIITFNDSVSVPGFDFGPILLGLQSFVNYESQGYSALNIKLKSINKFRLGFTKLKTKKREFANDDKLTLCVSDSHLQESFVDTIFSKFMPGQSTAIKSIGLRCTSDMNMISVQFSPAILLTELCPKREGDVNSNNLNVNYDNTEFRKISIKYSFLEDLRNCLNRNELSSDDCFKDSRTANPGSLQLLAGCHRQDKKLLDIDTCFGYLSEE